jgi:hypothetical protein
MPQLGDVDVFDSISSDDLWCDEFYSSLAGDRLGFILKDI